ATLCARFLRNKPPSCEMRAVGPRCCTQSVQVGAGFSASNLERSDARDDARLMQSTRPSRFASGLLASGLLALLAVTPGAVASAQTTTTNNGVTRVELAQGSPANAPGQELYLQEVRIAPGAKLPTHFH